MKVIHPLTTAARLLYHHVLLFFMGSIGTKEERSYFLFITPLSWGLQDLVQLFPFSPEILFN